MVRTIFQQVVTLSAPSIRYRKILGRVNEGQAGFKLFDAVELAKINFELRICDAVCFKSMYVLGPAV